jgi:uncharacterized integral membrane protein
MKGLKIIPLFLAIMGMTYAGMLFVQANNDEVVVKMGAYVSPPMAVGFMVLTSIFIGMVICGFLCSVEMLALYVQNRKLKKKLGSLMVTPKVQVPTAPAAPADISTPKATGRFT